MRQTHEGGARMRILLWHKAPPCASERSSDVLAALGWTRQSLIPLCLLLSTPVFAAVTGTVTNQTTGKPQAGATVALYKLATATGLELIDQAKSDAQGNFTINQTPLGPHLIRTAFDGVTYNHMLPPGQPTTGITIEVFNASKQPGGATVAKHMILF